MHQEHKVRKTILGLVAVLALVSAVMSQPQCGGDPCKGAVQRVYDGGDCKGSYELMNHFSGFDNDMNTCYPAITGSESVIRTCGGGWLTIATYTGRGCNTSAAFVTDEQQTELCINENNGRSSFAIYCSAADAQARSPKAPIKGGPAPAPKFDKIGPTPTCNDTACPEYYATTTEYSSNDCSGAPTRTYSFYGPVQVGACVTDDRIPAPLGPLNAHLVCDEADATVAIYYSRNGCTYASSHLRTRSSINRCSRDTSSGSKMLHCQPRPAGAPIISPISPAPASSSSTNFIPAIWTLSVLILSLLLAY